MCDIRNFFGGRASPRPAKKRSNMAVRNSFSIKNILLSLLFLALAIFLPGLAARVPGLASVLLVMHIPVYLCGFVCGAPLGFAIGMVAPVLASVILGSPALFPEGVAMMFELAFYGLLAGAFYDTFRRSMGSHRVGASYLALLVAMLGGRIAWGLAMLVIALCTPVTFSWNEFIYGAFTGEVAAIVLHVVIVPGLVAQTRK